MNTTLLKFIQKLDIQTVPADRQEVLTPLIEYLKDKKANYQSIQLNFICTHNSRRSHLGQIWAKTMASFYGISSLDTYSAGTEATAVFHKIIETLQKTGYESFKLSDGDNPVHAVKYDKSALPLIAFSKTLEHSFNPRDGFAAIMTCDSANEACPFISGAEKRFPVMYEDPKKFDNTDLQDQMYAERSQQIATEMKYIFNRVVG